MGAPRRSLQVDRQLRVLQLAKDSAALGARVRTISHLSDLPPRELLYLLFPDRSSVPRGRAPDSPEWYHATNLLCRLEASIVLSLYGRLRDCTFAAADALIGAYRHYCKLCEPSRRITFDRAFDLVAHMDGIWLTDKRSFSLVTCAACRSEHLAPFGTAVANNECPFCKLVQRYRSDHRVQAAFPARPLPDVGAISLGVMQVMTTKQGAEEVGIRECSDVGHRLVPIDSRSTALTELNLPSSAPQCRAP